jgi:hypothetical protein
MSTWAEIKTAVESAVSSAMPALVRTPVNLDGPTVSWVDGPRPFGRHRLLLSVVSTVFDHDRDSALAEGGEQVLNSMATVTVQVQAESIHDRSSAPGDALWLIEQVRLGLRRVSVREALELAEMAIVGFPGSTVSRSYPADGRVVSAHSFDAAFRVLLEYDASDEDGGLIEHVEVEGAVATPPDVNDLADVEIAVDEPDPEP